MSPLPTSRPPKDLKLAVDQLWQMMNDLTLLLNRSVALKTAAAPAATRATVVVAAGSGGGGSGSYEPLIPKSTGYAKWSGAAWMFLNEIYIIAGSMTSLEFWGLSSPPAVINNKVIIYWLLAEPGKLYMLVGDGTPTGTTYCIFDGTATI